MLWSLKVNAPEVISFLIKDLKLKDNKRNQDNISVVLANFMKNGGVFETSIDLHRKIPQGYNPNKLYKAGIVNVEKTLEEYGYVTIKKGFKCGGFSKMSEITATEKLYPMLDEIREILYHSKTQYVIVSNKKDGLVDYKDNEITELSRDFLGRFNSYLSKQHIWHHKHPQLTLSCNDMFRRFRDHNKELGGRFFSGFQNIKSCDRPDIEINGEKTTELDYVAMHPSILYAVKGLNIKDEIDDPYGVETQVHPDKVVNRKAIKTLLLTMLATTRTDYAVRAVMYSLVKGREFDTSVLDYQTMKQAAMELETKHHKIASAFYQGKEYPLRLQYYESTVCMLVMDEMAKQDICVLPIHDSFVAPVKNRNQLKEAMINNFKATFNGVEPNIEQKF